MKREKTKPARRLHWIRSWKADPKSAGMSKAKWEEMRLATRERWSQSWKVNRMMAGMS